MPDSDGILTRLAPPADARLAYGPAPQQFGDLRLPASGGPHPVALMVHGGFWRARYSLDHIGHLCQALTDAGFATWSVEYRRLGDPMGGWPHTLLDVAAAADHLRILAPNFNLDLDRTVAIGHSAGGHLALWLAARRRISPSSALYTVDPLDLQRSIALAGVSDLREAWRLGLGDGVVQHLLDGTPDSVPERYQCASPAELLPLGVPQVLIHGTRDRIVPFAMSRRYEALARSAGDVLQLVPLVNMQHFEPIDPQSRAWPFVLQAIRGPQWPW